MAATPPAPPAETEEAGPAVAPAPIEPDYPKQALTPELLFGMLVGDMAASHGNRPLAADAWLDVARQTRDPRAARRAMELAFAAGKVDQSMQAAQIWKSIEPESPIAQQMLINLLIRTNRLNEAEAELAAWMAKRPADVPAIFLQLAAQWPSQSKPEATRALTDRLAAQYPELGEAAFASAVAAVRAGDKPAGLIAADEALRRKPDWEHGMLYRAALGEEVNPGSAIPYLSAQLKRQPTSRALRSALATRHADARQFDAARKLYAGLIKDFPDQIEFLVGDAHCAIQLQDYPGAEIVLRRAIALGTPQLGTLRYYLGLVAEQQNKLAEARTEFEQITEGEYAAQAATHLARIEAQAGRQEAAMAAVARLPERTADEQIAKIQLESQVLRELKQLDAARAALDRGLGKHKDHPELIYERSLIHDLQGDIAASERDLRQYLALKPDNPIGLNALGYTLANRTNRFDEAEALLRQALAKEPDNPVIIDSMGWLEYRRGNLAEAIRLLDKAFKKLPDPEIAAHLGEALWQSGRQRDALKIWEQGRKSDPADEVLLETIQRLTGK
ncbi:tetratricopeptide repeat protein [Chitinimonas sp. BJYL2]|uniref:tetratricopeptide repeat protein n=1 Tax=Chitinimonas sp. BJYL2 TaxID=2976696 RepID=UPI0022B33C47|nr:tetratricopeptide repeat protein [Chitinimonas sp. BJYL2]